MTTRELIARYRQLREQQRAGTLAPWEHDELQRIARKLGPLVLDA